MIETAHAQTGSSRARRSAWLKISMVTAGAVLLVIGLALGGTLNSHNGQIAAQQARIRVLQQRLTVVRAQSTSAKTRMEAAQTQARTATATANAKAAAKYSSREAAVQKLQRKLAREQGIVQASTISEDGVYVVGKDIPAGTYHTTGGAQCYYATLGSTDTSNIQNNNNFNGPETVDVSGAYAFQISGGCTWSREG
jgi:multidrug efflux pump subunit AcrA (membrane-fusion protein)